MSDAETPKTNLQFGDHTRIEGSVVTGNQLTTGGITAREGSTIIVAGGNVSFTPAGAPSEKGGVPIDTGIPPIDELIYYSVNCDLQIDHLEETLAAHGTQPCCMLACMVHGDIDQAHEMFLKRVRIEVLPQVLDLDLDRTPIGVYQLPWPGQLLRLEDLPRLLEKSLAESVLEDRKGTKDQISERFAAFQGPILIQTHIYQNVYQRWGIKALDAFMRFWMEWPEQAPSQRLMIFVCVYYQPTLKQAFFNRLFKRDPRADLQRFIGSLAAAPTGPSHWIGLPPIEGANLQDATNWARREEVSQLFDSELIVDELQQFYLERSRQAKEAILIPLGTLAKHLKEIVPKYFRS